MLTINAGDTPDRVRVAGRLDAQTAPAAQQFLDALQGVVTLDCGALDYIASAGLGVLLRTHKRLLAGGGRLRLAGVRGPVRDVFCYAGFDQLFEIEPLA